MDAVTGDVVGLSRDSGLGLVDAVVASTAMPGAAATVRHGSLRLMDGGVHSGDNPELAGGATSMVVLAPLEGVRASWDRHGRPTGQFGGFEGCAV